MIKFIIFIFIFLISCKIENIRYTFPEDQELKRKQNAGNLFGNEDGIVLFKGEVKKNDNIKNDDIFQKSLNIISNILPIAIVDKNSNLIITDWGMIENISNDKELYKINIIINNENDINISVFKKNDNLRNKDVENKIKQLIINNN